MHAIPVSVACSFQSVCVACFFLWLPSIYMITWNYYDPSSQSAVYSLFITPSSSLCICHLLFAHFDAPNTNQLDILGYARKKERCWYILVSSTCYFNFPLAPFLLFPWYCFFSSPSVGVVILRSANIRTDPTISDIIK